MSGEHVFQITWFREGTYLIVPSLVLLVPLFIISLSLFLLKYFPKETTSSSPKYAIPSKVERVSYWGVTKGLDCDWETGISTLMGKIIMGEVGKRDTRDEEEVMIGVSIWEERIVEMEGIYTWENLIGEDVRVVWGVWEVNEIGGEEGEVRLGTSFNTDGSLEVSSRIGFKFNSEKENERMKNQKYFQTTVY